jgi:hypothetical protein
MTLQSMEFMILVYDLKQHFRILHITLHRKQGVKNMTLQYMEFMILVYDLKQHF